MTVIKQADVIQSVADALQYISYYHPVDFIQAVHEAYLRGESPAARDAMAQILINSRMCAMGRRPICQDTGAANIHIKYGVQAKTDFRRSLQEICDEGTPGFFLKWIVPRGL